MLEPKWLRTSKTQVVCKTWELRDEGFRPSFSHPRGMVAGLLLGSQKRVATNININIKIQMHEYRHRSLPLPHATVDGITQHTIYCANYVTSTHTHIKSFFVGGFQAWHESVDSSKQRLWPCKTVHAKGHLYMWELSCVCQLLFARASIAEEFN